MTFKRKAISGAVAASMLMLGLVAAVACQGGATEGPGSTATRDPMATAPTVTRVADDRSPTAPPTGTATQADAATATATTTGTGPPESAGTSAAAAPTATVTPTPEPSPTETPEPTLAAWEVLLVISNGAGATATIRAEVADTRAERSYGLMGRSELGADAGMLFLFGRTVHTAFWMKNTYVPLDIAFLAEDGTVQEILKGMPESEDLLQPALPYLYVLEVNQGWFERHGLGAGATVAIPDNLKDGGTP